MGGPSGFCKQNPRTRTAPYGWNETDPSGRFDISDGFRLFRKHSIVGTTADMRASLIDFCRSAEIFLFLYSYAQHVSLHRLYPYDV